MWHVVIFDHSIKLGDFDSLDTVAWRVNAQGARTHTSLGNENVSTQKPKVKWNIQWVGTMSGHLIVYCLNLCQQWPFNVRLNGHQTKLCSLWCFIAPAIPAVIAVIEPETTWFSPTFVQPSHFLWRVADVCNHTRTQKPCDIPSVSLCRSEISASCPVAVCERS